MFEDVYKEKTRELERQQVWHEHKLSFNFQSTAIANKIKGLAKPCGIIAQAHMEQHTAMYPNNYSIGH